MHALLLLGSSAFLFCLLLTPLCRNIFVRAGIVDHPDGSRKFHLRAVPRVGGIPIALSYAGALALLVWLHPDGKLYIQHGQVLHALLPAAAIIFITGLLDDVFGLKPWQKLIGQSVAAGLAVYLGARLNMTYLPSSLSNTISVFWLIGCTNAVNLIDGMDGLATGVGLLATITTLFVALLSGNVGLALATVPLAGCLLAFLRYNFSPASVFLGDSGSLTIGFVLGCFGLIWSGNAGTMLGIAAPLMALALPLVDVGVAIGRRYLRKVPIFEGDRGHIHHMVLGLGFSPRGAALVLYGVCSLFACFALLESFTGKGLRWPILMIFCALVLLGIRRLDYVEFAAFGKMLSHKTMRQAVHDEIYLEDLSRALADAHSLEARWALILGACDKLHFASAYMEVEGVSFYEEFVSNPENASCQIQLAFGDYGYLLLTRMPGEVSPRIMMAVLDYLQSAVPICPRALEPQVSPATSTTAA